MAKKIREEVEKALKRLENLMEAYPDGASLETLGKHYGPEIGERTLRRYLVILQQQGKVQTTGAARSTLYHLIQHGSPADDKPVSSSESQIPLSLESQAVQRLLQQPESNRIP